MKLKKIEEITSVLAQMYNTLSKWEIRSVALDNPSVVVVFFSFLKYISLYKEELKLSYPEKYDIDFLTLLYGQKITQEEFMAHIADLEEQLGFDKGILKSFITDLQLLSLENETKELLDMINKVEIKADEQDVLYTAVAEYLSIQSRNDMRFASEYTTDNKLAKLMGELIEVQDGMTVYDPATGYSILLSEATQRKDVLVYAQDINRLSAAVSIMLLVMSGQKKVIVGCDDTITHPLTFELDNKKFDRVLSIPPFGLRIGKEMAIIKSGQQADAFEYGLAYKLSGELVFARHLIASLKEDGVGLLLVPMSTLFKGGNEGKIREQMIKDNYIDTVIEMPVGILPNTNVKTALVLFKKGRKENDIYFMDLSKEECKSYTEKIGRVGVRFTDLGIEKVTEIVRSKKEASGIAVQVNREQVIKQNVNLCPGSYLQVELDQVENLNDVGELLNKNKRLFKQLEEVEIKLHQTIIRLK